MVKSLKQKHRLIIILIQIIVIFAINKTLFNTILPSENKSLWFVAALLNILLANNLITPYYTKPVDSLSYSIAAIIPLFFVGSYPSTVFSEWVKIILISYFCIIIVLSIVCILFYDSKYQKLNSASHTLRYLLGGMGSANTIFLGVLIYSLIEFHYNSSKEILVISISYMVFITQNPYSFFYKFYLNNLKSRNQNVLGNSEILYYQYPNIIITRKPLETNIPYLTPVVILDGISGTQLGQYIGDFAKSDGIYSRILIISKSIHKESLGRIELPFVNTAYYLDKQKLPEEINSKCKKKILGFVTSNSNISTVFFQITKNQNLKIGSLLQCKIHDDDYLYQIIDAITKYDNIDKGNTYGYLRVPARAIGKWDVEKSRFLTPSWVPEMYTPVFESTKTSTTSVQENTPIGKFPESDYPVLIKDINSLVTHNTAILGILGIGKSMLAIEIVERLLSERIKVICLDLTNQYLNELGSFVDEQYEEHCIKKIREAGEMDQSNFEEDPSKGGSLNNFIEALKSDMQDLIDNDKNRHLKIYNPNELVATKQRSEPRSFTNDGRNWKREAQLYSLTPVEMTQIITETLLTIVSDEMRDHAKVCLVFEEAHSLVPEWNSVVNESDKNATSGTARAILQGRKYGLGCLLISQRTANVTKTILNQCNNIFAMRTFDDTGKTFLSNYIGEDYTNILSDIPERHSVFFGKSSSCENPVLIRLNDRKYFTDTFRVHHSILSPTKQPMRIEVPRP